MNSNEFNLYITALESHINFMRNNIEEDETACESLLSKAEQQKENAKNKLLKASINFIAAKSVNALQTSVKNFTTEMRRNIKENVRKIAIPLGMDDVECIDNHNMIKFIELNRNRFYSIIDIVDTLINKFDKICKNNKKLDMLKELEMRIDILKVDYNRWTSNMSGTKVLNKDLCDTIKELNNILGRIDKLNESLDIICKYIKTNSSDLDYTDQEYIKEIMKLINSFTEFIELIINQIKGSISFVKKTQNIFASNKTTISNKNDYLNLMKK